MNTGKHYLTKAGRALVLSLIGAVQSRCLQRQVEKRDSEAGSDICN